MEDFIVYIPIFFFAIVQSVFGLGLLVFGTPTFLLLGFDFLDTLTYLIPASVTISILQIIDTKTDKPEISKSLYILCLPGIAVGLYFAKSAAVGSYLDILIGLALILSAAVRQFANARSILKTIIDRHAAVYHLVMGVAHGLTNLGGAFLTVFASSSFVLKEDIRYTIAFYYFCFGVIQLFMLAAVLGMGEQIIQHLPGAAVAAFVYFTFGKAIFLRASNPMFHGILTLFMFAYGVIILIRA